MLSRDMQRLIAMDAKIAELEGLYKRERERELDENRHTLLLSRGIKNQILVMNRARNKLASMLRDKPGKNATYSIELVRRRENYENAIEDKKRLEKEIEGAGLAHLVAQTKESERRYKELLAEMKPQLARISMYQRSLTNWTKKKPSDLSNRLLRNKLPKLYDPLKDAKAFEVEKDESFYGTGPMDEEIVEYVKEYNNPLKNDPNWDRKTNTQATIIPRSEYKLSDEELGAEISRLEKESNLLSIISNAPTSPIEDELASSSSSEERIAIKLEEKPQLDAPTFEAERKRVVIE